MSSQFPLSESNTKVTPESPEIQGLKFLSLKYKGQLIRVYHIKLVADFVRMSREGLKTWRRTGVLPNSLFWRTVRPNLIRAHLDGRIIDKGTMHFYSQEEILTLKYLLTKYGSRCGHNTRFVSELHSRFTAIRARFEAGISAQDLVPVIIAYPNMQAFTARINAIFYEDATDTLASSAQAAQLLLS